MGLERVGDVLEEDEAEDDVLVLGGVHIVAHLVGCRPHRRLEAEIGPVRAVAVLGLRFPSHRPSLASPNLVRHSTSASSTVQPSRSTGRRCHTSRKARWATRAVSRGGASKRYRLSAVTWPIACRTAVYGLESEADRRYQTASDHHSHPHLMRSSLFRICAQKMPEVASCAQKDA